MQKRWQIIQQADPGTVEALAKSINTPNWIANVLAQRGIHTFDGAKDFFNPSLSSLHNPFLMKGMDIAVERILQALEQKQNIMVYGDYDVDGTTSVALMYTYLASQDASVSYYIPDRYKEGYGVSQQGIDFASDNDISLIISLDCGIKAVDNVEYANSKGIDFIICDHHKPGEIIPDAIAVLDPKQDDCSYPFTELSGCGVGFKLIQALEEKKGNSVEDLIPYLDLVAVSIAADIVPLVGENRILAAIGFQVLSQSPRVGLDVIIPQGKKKHLKISDVVFNVAPKINAAGRIDHAGKAVELLIATNEMNARSIVYSINEMNNYRRELDSSITEEAIEQILNQPPKDDQYATVVYHPEWNKGVIGIVASRLVDAFYRPTVVFTKGEDGDLVASARSVEGFDLYSALDNCKDLLLKFGGHMYAAGLTIAENQLPAFTERFEEEVKTRILHHQRQPTIEIDTTVDFDELDSKAFRIIERMNPFGPQNMTPQLLTKNVCYAGTHKLMGPQEEHVKFEVIQQNGSAIFTAIAFNWGHQIKKIKKQNFDIVYSLEINRWQGREHPQLIVKDIKFHE